MLRIVMEDMKKTQNKLLKMKTIISEIKKYIYCMEIIFDATEEKISVLEDLAIETM